MPKPLVSVLLACYNHERFVEASVRSVMAQTGVDFELIVIDDGSKDSSPKILEALSRELGFTYVNRPNKGVVATLNELLEMAQGKYFCTFASDDMMPQGRLAIQSEYLEKNPGAIACFGQIQTMDADGNICENLDPRYTKSIPQVTFEEFFLGQKELHGCSEMIRLEEFKKLGGYDEQIGQEDFPMMLKLLSVSSPLPVIEANTCYYRIHGNNMSGIDSAENVNWLYTNMVDTINCYKDHPLYNKAMPLWKMRWFSALAYKNKLEAIKKLPKLASMTLAFWIRVTKLFIPSGFLRH